MAAGEARGDRVKREKESWLGSLLYCTSIQLSSREELPSGQFTVNLYAFTYELSVHDIVHPYMNSYIWIA